MPQDYLPGLSWLGALIATMTCSWDRLIGREKE